MGAMYGGTRKKIGLFLGVKTSSGGMFQYAQTILDSAAQLDPARYEVVIAYDDNAWQKIITNNGVSAHPLKNCTAGQLIANACMALCLPPAFCRIAGRYYNPLVRELESMKCDLWIFPAQESISYQIRSPVLVSIHDLMHRYESHFAEVSSKFRYKIREQRFSSIARVARGVFVDSAIGQSQVCESYGVLPAKVFPLPYIAPRYMHHEIEQDDFDQRYELPAKFLFYPAQFWSHKNHKRLFEALKLVAQEYPDVMLILSGGRRFGFEEVYGYTVELGVEQMVKFVGYVPDDDLRGFYKRARALVMPTLFGPTNIPPLEAMVVGCPVLISDIYGMREQSGDAAMYFNPNASAEIADCIKLIWSDDSLSKTMREKGLARSNTQNPAVFSRKFKQVVDTLTDKA